MKKKLICTAIILTMVTSLTACGSNADSNIMSDDGSMTETEEIATKDEAENETNMVVANVTSSAYNKDNADNSTNNPATTTSQPASSDSKKNTSTESTAPATEAPRQDSHTTTETPATTEGSSTEKSWDDYYTDYINSKTETSENKECPRYSTGNHKWKDHYMTITVVDQEAYDEKIPTGEYYTTLEEHTYASAYAENPETGMYTDYVCDVDVTGMKASDAREYVKSMGYRIGNTRITYETVPDYDNPIYEIVHHDAVTHTERVFDYTDCTVCGAHK
ncbi:MAG: hypothetical protein NC412_12385 [Roseburia sp.]|nr:hypothetical protein [Roseburia sp.]MCM1278331.1 hypothetical protein [Robinsoniella sp.]